MKQVTDGEKSRPIVPVGAGNSGNRAMSVRTALVRSLDEALRAAVVAWAAADMNRHAVARWCCVGRRRGDPRLLKTFRSWSWSSQLEPSQSGVIAHTRADSPTFVGLPGETPFAE